MNEELKEAEERARIWLENLEQWQHAARAELKKLKKEGICCCLNVLPFFLLKHQMKGL